MNELRILDGAEILDGPGGTLDGSEWTLDDLRKTRWYRNRR